MNVLVVGGGGREHALVWKLSASSLVKRLFAAPGNPGTAQAAENVPLKADDLPGIVKFVKGNKIDLVVIGPEDPLAAGLTDALAQTSAKVFGPVAAGARLEADKWFAKELMRAQSVPTAEARVFTDPAAAEEYVTVRDEPCVIKASGLAMGKGVRVCYRTSDAIDAIDSIMKKRAHGDAGARIVIEELLNGPEVSLLAFVSGRSIYVMEAAQDHKPIDDGDTGPMTGGMGAYTPTPVVDEAALSTIESDVLVPIVDGLIREGIDYRGVLYAGMMMTPKGPKVLEFNCRFGDPETQPLMMRLQSDLAEVMLATADGKLEDVTLRWDPRPSLCVVASSKGYPGPYAKGVAIHGVDAADRLDDVKVFHCGTRMQSGQLVTDGGRVLAVTALGDTIADAQKRAYDAMSLIHFEGMHFRTDIGHQAVRPK